MVSTSIPSIQEKQRIIHLREVSAVNSWGKYIAMLGFHPALIQQFPIRCSVCLKDTFPILMQIYVKLGRLYLTKARQFLEVIAQEQEWEAADFERRWNEI
ncbi:hypothetical protein Riv7116_6325 [Rivularia sp. PCC 7116]|nr:hypothetical protein [Rivularia sp. PCC 7116]AFY58667.1 hypothetical protein Riv7116_6325 [Rivularia sp. PCC 7116]